MIKYVLNFILLFLLSTSAINVSCMDDVEQGSDEEIMGSSDGNNDDEDADNENSSDNDNENNDSNDSSASNDDALVEQKDKQILQNKQHVRSLVDNILKLNVNSGNSNGKGTNVGKQIESLRTDIRALEKALSSYGKSTNGKRNSTKRSTASKKTYKKAYTAVPYKRKAWRKTKKRYTPHTKHYTSRFSQLHTVKNIPVLPVTNSYINRIRKSTINQRSPYRTYNPIYKIKYYGKGEYPSNSQESFTSRSAQIIKSSEYFDPNCASKKC